MNPLILIYLIDLMINVEICTHGIALPWNYSDQNPLIIKLIVTMLC